jgi:hypothetical protein
MIGSLEATLELFFCLSWRVDVSVIRMDNELPELVLLVWLEAKCHSCRL